MDELVQLNRSLEVLFKTVESIDDDYTRRNVALRLTAAIYSMHSALPVPTTPTAYVPPTCPHCGRSVNVTLW
jgi:hypothetical protein